MYLLHPKTSELSQTMQWLLNQVTSQDRFLLLGLKSHPLYLFILDPRLRTEIFSAESFADFTLQGKRICLVYSKVAFAKILEV